MSIRASRSIPMRSISIPNWNPVSAKHKYLPVRLLALDTIYCDENSQWNDFLVDYEPRKPCIHGKRNEPPSDQTTWRGVSGVQDGQGTRGMRETSARIRSMWTGRCSLWRNLVDRPLHGEKTRKQQARRTYSYEAN